MLNKDFLVKFQDLDINELESELENRRSKLFNLIEVENLEEVMEEIEVLEFLINKAEING